MKKNILNIKTGLWMTMLLMVLSFTATSCSDDDDSSGGVPVITGVRITDPEYADSLFVKASPGSIIAIIGENLSNAYAVYVNDQEVFLNPTLNTDHSIIVTIPSEEDGFVLSSTDPSLSDEIRVETARGVAIYSFKVTAPSPSISRLDAEYPRNAGDVMTINGLNLVDIEDAYITDIAYADLMAMTFDEVPGNRTQITELETITADHHLNSNNYYETTSVLEAIVPEGAPESGTLVLECAAGNAYIGFSVRPGVPIINFVSNDMPQIGETLLITGTELLQATLSYGDVTLTEDDFYTSETYDTIKVEFSKKPTEGSGTTLTVTTPGGTASVERFYDHSTILTTFDGDATDNGWGPNCSYGDSGTDDGIYAHIDVTDSGSNWWGTMIYYRKDWNGNSFPLSDNIPDDASASDVYLAFNVYDNNSDINSDSFSGYFRYLIQPLTDAEYYYDNGFAWDSYDETWFFDQPVLADSEGQAHKGVWYRAVVSLNNFECFTGLTYAGIKSVGINQWRIMEYNQGTSKGEVDVKFDNVRVIYIPSN